MTNTSNGFDFYKKYLKFFSTRLVQGIIQARLGDEVESKCFAFAEAQDWFNMKIDELGEISAYMKSNIKNYPPAGAITLEFLLFTPSGQRLPLEAWVLSSTTAENQQGCALNDLYHSMSTLLRSAIISARMSPMHRLYVKKQNQESFIIMYRVFENDKVEMSDMGTGKKIRKIGELQSQFGNITLELHYRTSMHFEEPEIAPEIILDDDEEEDEVEQLVEEEEDCDRTVVDEPMGGTPTAPVPIMQATKSRKASGSVESANSGGSSISREVAPRFVLGQSTSSEESRHSEQPPVQEGERRPSIADLRNHSFPFVNLLQSAYHPSNGSSKKNISSISLDTPKEASEEENQKEKSENPENPENPEENEDNDDEESEEEEEEEELISPIPAPAPVIVEKEKSIEKLAESFRVAKIEDVVIEEEEEEQEEAAPQNESMELSEDSFVHFNQLSEIAGAPSIGTELGDYLKQLKAAPDMFRIGEIDFARTDVATELDKLGSYTRKFNEFIQHVNSISDE